MASRGSNLVIRGSNLVIRGGVVCGTWRVRASALEISWFAEAGPPPTAAVRAETDDFAHRQGRELRLTLDRS